MGIVKGLKNINQHLEQDNAPKGDGVKAKFLKVNDGQTFRIRFLQELDPDSPTYNDKAGLGFLAIEHQSPKDFKRHALCSVDEGACWACEQHSKDYKAGWRQKSKLYVNVLVMPDNEDPYVAVLSQGNGPKSVTPWLLEYAGDNGSITAQAFKIKRTGAGQTDTTYTLTPGKFDATQYDVLQHELFDLDKVVRAVPYEEQQAFYLGENAATTASADSTSSEVEW